MDVAQENMTGVVYPPLEWLIQVIEPNALFTVRIIAHWEDRNQKAQHYWTGVDRCPSQFPTIRRDIALTGIANPAPFELTYLFGIPLTVAIPSGEMISSRVVEWQTWVISPWIPEGKTPILGSNFRSSTAKVRNAFLVRVPLHYW